MNSLEKNNIAFIRSEFEDFECFKDTAAKWLLDFKQLDAGKFNGSISILDTPRVQLGETSLNRKLEQNGITPLGYRTFVITQDNKSAYRWRGHKVTGNDILITPRSGEFESISNPGWGIYTISIAEEIIEEFKENNEIRKLGALDNNLEKLVLQDGSMAYLRNRLQYTLDLLNNNPQHIQQIADQEKLEKEIPEMLLNTLLLGSESSSPPISRIRDVAFKKAISYLNNSSTDLPTIKQLCIIAGASQRTLEYAFNEKYGFGPKEYMKKTSLNLVMQELNISNPGTTKIKDVASRYGFWHMGHFGEDYKYLFGELPSETLYNSKHLAEPIQYRSLDRENWER